jgi:RNA polymerase sigma factor (sigma-70 family)
MVGRSAGAELLNRLNTLTHVGVVGNLSDAQLLARFLARGGPPAEAAFEALVARHGPMVLDVCFRILRDSHEAQDAFQATFLILASRARSIRQRDALAGWLLGVARRVAVRARANQARRRAYEGRAAELRADRTGDRLESWPELHEEIGRLPERYREPVVLCYLEGLSTDAAALRLGCPKGTVLSRLSRARERLRRRLIRRGLTPPALLPADGRCSEAAPAALPLGLITATVRASRGFAEHSATAAGLSSTSAVVLARGAIYAMMISKLKVLGAALLACVLTLVGLQTFARPFGGTGVQAGSEPKADESQATLTQSVEKLQAELDESARRITEMRKALQDLRADLEARRASRQPSIATKAAIRLAEAIKTDSSQAVSRLADVLKRHPPRLSEEVGWGYQIYMLDLVEGGMTLIADEPLPQQYCSGMPRWSHDGTRILFDTTGVEWPRGRLMAIEARDGRPVFRDLGLGNNPTFSPDDKWIAFLLHASAELGADTGVWLMRADGSQRRRVADFGAPFWSPDGREFLINSYSLPTTSTVLNLQTKEGGVIEVPGHQIFSWPNWVGPGTMVSPLAPKEKYEGDSIALLDVRKPAEAKIIEVLWKRSQDLDVTPRWLAYRPGTDQFYFVGVEPKKREIYMVQRGGSLPAKRLGVVEHYVKGMNHQQLGGLSFSPDGRYLLFEAHRPERE